MSAQRGRERSPAGDHPVDVAVIGYGYWGPKLLRNLAAIPGCRLTGICDAAPERLTAAAAMHPGVSLTGSPADLFSGPGVDAVVISTPVSTHYPLALAGAPRRQARVRREASCGLGGGGERACRRGMLTRARAHGRPRLRLRGRGSKGARADRLGTVRRDPLLRLRSPQLGPVPAGRRRALGPRRPRPLDTRLPRRRAAACGLRDRHQPPGRQAREHRVPDRSSTSPTCSPM